MNTSDRLPDNRPSGEVFKIGGLAHFDFLHKRKENVLPPVSKIQKKYLW